jgi:fibronectin-binding autotransporter adhesin
LFRGGSKGDFSIGGTLTNNNLIQLAGAGAGNTLLVHNLVGQGGSRVAMNTVLGGDGSNSDLIVISGGSASGRTILDIANAGGRGAATTGNGILVVAGASPATTTPGAFALDAPLEAGPYQYALFRGARDFTTANAWYLRSENPNPPLPPSEIPQSVPPPPPVIAPGEPVPPPLEPYVPYYRSEVSLYTALPSMALNYGRTLIGTLHDRVGEEEQLRGAAGDLAGPSGAWARVVGQDGQWDAGTGGIYRDGPSFDDNMIAVQAGLDLYRAERADGARDFAGVLAAVGHGHGGVSNYDDASAGNDRFDSYSIGGYWTRFGANGWYLDGVLQGSWYDARALSNEPYSLSTHGFSAALSIEGGYPFRIASDWSLEPQGQLIYQTLHLDNASDAAASVQFHDGESLAGRIGARASRSWQWDPARLLSGWFFANVWHEFKANTTTAFSSENGNVPFHSDLGGSWWEVGAGIDAQLGDSASLYASVGYDKGFSRGIKAIDGNVGMRFSW